MRTSSRPWMMGTKIAVFLLMLSLYLIAVERIACASRVEKFLNEKTGRMTTMKTPAVILDDVWCKSRYSSCRMFCLVQHLFTG